AIVSVSGGAGSYAYSWAPSGGTNDTATGLSAGTYTVTITDGNNCTTTATATILNSGGPTAIAGVISDESCNGGTTGSATVNASGGTSPYTYLWSPAGGTNATATGLASGTYTVTVTDLNGCSS